jgi:RNA polymerase sigma-70 factor (ECF subfamily)
MEAYGLKAKASVREYVLVLRCQAGDEKAFADLLNRFGPRTLRYLKGLLEPEAAQDAHQEVWLTVYRRISDLSNPGGFRTWLFRITRHRAIDFLRREQRESELLEVVAREAPEFSRGMAEPTVSTLDDPALKTAMARLSPAQRDVLQLRFWETMSYQEIALILGCPLGTVRSRIHHAKRVLRHALAEA